MSEGNNAVIANALAVAGTSAEIATLDRLDEILLTGDIGGAEIVDDPAEIARSIVQQLLTAENDEELQDFGNAEGWKNYLDIPMELHGFRWRASTIEGEGSPIYFIVSAIKLDDGSRKVLTTGSMNVLAQLSNMARRGTLNGSVWMLTEADKLTARGYKPMWLVQPEAVKQANRDRAAAADQGSYVDVNGPDGGQTVEPPPATPKGK